MKNATGDLTPSLTKAGPEHWGQCLKQISSNRAHVSGLCLLDIDVARLSRANCTLIETKLSEHTLRAESHHGISTLQSWGKESWPEYTQQILKANRHGRPRCKETIPLDQAKKALGWPPWRVRMRLKIEASLVVDHLTLSLPQRIRPSGVGPSSPSAFRKGRLDLLNPVDPLGLDRLKFLRHGGERP